MRLKDWRQGGERRVRRTGIIPGVMIQHFDRERERREGERKKEQERKNKAGEQGGREEGRKGGWRSDA